MKKKLKYFMNWFFFQYKILKRNLWDKFNFEINYPNIWKWTPGIKYIPQNFILMKKLYKKNIINNYDIVHFNNTENFLNFKPQKNQVSIAESHWFDFWVNYAGFVKDEKNILKNIVWRCIDLLFGWKIRKKIQEFDIYYCSTPDMLEPLRKKVRKDVKWLPNPIDTSIFKPEWEIIKLEWFPSFFFPTRVHWDKKPEVAINIFRNYIKPNYPNATLHLLNQWYEVDKYKKILSDKSTYYWHDFMDKETLASKIRWSDYCFWDFSIWWLSLMPMQIMASKKPIISYDMHEILKIPREELEEFTKKLMNDDKFRNEYIERNYNYIMEYHTEESICKMHIDNLRPFIKSKLNINI